MSALVEITTNQLLIRLEQAPSGEMVNLSRMDFRRVDMRHPDVREKFKEVTDHAASSRDQNPYYIDMSFSNISGRDFSDYNLSHVIMNGVTAEHTVFTNADLSDTQLEDATLDYADMRQAKLHFTKLHYASIVGVNFAGADLRTTYGLKLRSPGTETIDRMKVIGSIKNAMLPDNLPDDTLQQIEKQIGEQQARKKKSSDKKPEKKAPEDW